MEEADILWGDLTPAGPCYICGDKRDHDGLPHGKVTGDGKTRADQHEHTWVPSPGYALTNFRMCEHCGEVGWLM